MRWAFYLRLTAIITKEFTQMFRDFSTVGMMLMIPLIQILIFGFAINTNPKHLPTAIIVNDHSQFTRRFVSAMNNTDYFAIAYNDVTENQAQQLIHQGKVQFILTIPSDFTRELIRGGKPTILLEADTTDPVATTGAIAALSSLSNEVFDQDLQGINKALIASSPPFELRVHSLYNPSSITQYNIVPGLLGVVLTLTLVMVTAIAITREKELGTMENLLATPLKPIEVIIGKVLPYILIGYGQALIILAAAYWLFHIPMHGSVLLLLIATLPFIAANLAVGITLSTIAKNQLQANTSAVFFFLPSILLSGFLFPFYGMPTWAQYLGQCLPLTHYLRIVRGVILKGNGWIDIWPNVWPLLIILLVVTGIATLRYQRTLD
jgi:ABC-2 type transport system permease protein